MVGETWRQIIPMRVKYYFENLLIEEICLAYFEHLKKGETSEKATLQTIHDYQEIFNKNSLESVMTWLSFGYYQWELGRLIPFVREKAKNAYKELLERKEEFLSTDIYRDYLDRSYAPKTTHEQMLKYATLMSTAVAQTNMQPKKLRSASYFTKIDKLINKGIYAYAIDCNVLNQVGEICYIYFTVDFTQKRAAFADKTDLPVYIFNTYSVNMIDNIEKVKNVPMIDTTYSSKYKMNTQNVGKFIQNYSSNTSPIEFNNNCLWFMYSHKNTLGYRKITFLGFTERLFLSKDEIERRQKNVRNMFFSLQFEIIDKSIEKLLRNADKNLIICQNNQLIENLDVSNYTWEDL